MLKVLCKQFSLWKAFFFFFEDLSKKYKTPQDEIEEKEPEQAPKSSNKDRDVESDEEKEIFEASCML